MVIPFGYIIRDMGAGEREIRLDSAHLHHMLGVFGAGALLCCAFVETILWLHM